MLENEAVAELQQPQLVTGFINLFYCVTPKELLQAANHNSWQKRFYAFTGRSGTIFQFRIRFYLCYILIGRTNNLTCINELLHSVSTPAGYSGDSKDRSI